MPPKWISIRVSLMVFFAIDALKSMGAWFPLFCFKFGWVTSQVHLTALDEVTVMFNLIQTITLEAFCFLSPIGKCSMFPIFALENT